MNSTITPSACIIHKAASFRICHLTQALHLALCLSAGASLLTSHTAQALTCPVSSPTEITSADSNTDNCTIDNTGALNINNTASLTNLAGAQLNNFGSLSIQEMGHMDNQVGAYLNNYGSIAQSGTFINRGTLTNAADAYIFPVFSNSGRYRDIINEGIIDNSGFIGQVKTYNRGAISGIQLNNSGYIDWSRSYGSSIDNSGGMWLSYSHGGVFNNSGFIYRACVYGGIFNNTGIIDYAVILEDDATFNNARSIQADLYITSGSTFINQGGSTITPIYGVTITSAINSPYGTSTLQNDGIIETSVNNSRKWSSFEIDAQSSVTGAGTISFQSNAPQAIPLRLLVDGTLTQSDIQFTGLNIIGGSGTITTTNGIPIQINSETKIRPGDDVKEYIIPSTTGTLTFGSDLSLSGELVIDVAGTSDFDILQIFGNISFEVGSKLTFDFSNYLVKSGDQFDFLFADRVNGEENLEIATIGLTSQSSGLTRQLELTQDQNLRLVFSGTSVVPIPASLWLFGSGLLGFAGIHRRRQESRC